MNLLNWILLVWRLHLLLPKVMGGVQRLRLYWMTSKVYVGDELIGRGTYFHIHGGDQRIIQVQLAHLSDGCLIGMTLGDDDPVFFEESIDLTGVAQWVVNQLCAGMDDSVPEVWMALMFGREPGTT